MDVIFVLVLLALCAVTCWLVAVFARIGGGK
jgi:hypothetical protein